MFNYTILLFNKYGVIVDEREIEEENETKAVIYYLEQYKIQLEEGDSIEIKRAY